MRSQYRAYEKITRIFLVGALPAVVLGSDILKTNGFTACINNPSIMVNTLNIQYDRLAAAVIFDVGGTSSQAQNVTASLTVTAYGKQVYQKDFDPCDDATKVDQLCPGKFCWSTLSFFCLLISRGLVPAGNFAAKGNQTIPSSFAGQIPSIAFSIPDLEGDAKMELKSKDTGAGLACIESGINNGKTAEVHAVSYIAVSIAGAALLLTGLSALGAAGSTGSTTPSPNFSDVVGWFQSMAMNGMLSVNYPPVYRSFTKNFAFSGGLVPWNAMQTSIDNFRNHTGGNLTTDSVKYLRNATLAFSDGSVSNKSVVAKRNIEWFFWESPLITRDVSTSINGTGNGTSSANSTGTAGGDKVTHIVHGIQGYVEQLTIPQANTFMTVLLIFAIVIAAIAVGILLLKVILETWALYGSFPKKLTNFRKRYWGLLARTITNLILILYGVWTLYCVFQFTHGDSWAAKVLAGVTLGISTAILGFFSFRIWQVAHRYKKLEGDASALFEDKETWVKYSLFYDSYKRGYWWLFMPAIAYMFAKGCVIAAGDGHGLAQSIGQLIVECLMLILLLWSRPYEKKAGNWINMFIQIVRVLSIVCVMVFVEELGIAQTTKTVTGVILIAVQSVLTATLAILIAVNAIIICCKENPHRRRRKEAGMLRYVRAVAKVELRPCIEKVNREIDNLTPLDARNSLLMDPTDYHDLKGPRVDGYQMSTYKSRTDVDATRPYRDETPPPRSWNRRESTENLVSTAASIGRGHDRSTSRGSDSTSPPPVGRQPTVPHVMGGDRGRVY